MIFEDYFLTQSGESAISMRFSPRTATGLWNFSISSSGMASKAFQISGISGRIYDEDGYWIDSYAPNSVDIEAHLFPEHYVLYTSNLVTKIKPKDIFDVNYFKFESDNLNYVDVNVSGNSTDFENSKFLLVTTGDLADGNIYSFLQSLEDYPTVITSSITGSGISGYVDSASSYNAIVFGEEIGASDIIQSGYWHQVNTKKVCFNAAALTGFGLTAIKGSGLSNIYGTIFDKNLTHRVSDIGEYFSGFSSTGLIDGLTKTGEIVVGYSGLGNDYPMIMSFSSGDRPDWNFSGSYYLVNLPSGFNNVSDYSRQILINFFREIL